MATPSPITQAIQNIWDDAGWAAVLTLMAASGPIGLGAATFLKLPVIGQLTSWGLKQFMNWLIAKGVIQIKVGILTWLSTVAQAKWAAEIVILKQVDDTGGIMTPEQQAAFNAALQGIGENHGGIVGA